MTISRRHLAGSLGAAALASQTFSASQAVAAFSLGFVQQKRFGMHCI